MKITLSLLCMAALAASAFAQETRQDTTTSTADTAADNTGINERDRSGETMTPGDQANTPEDIEITAAIRRAIIAEETLSMTASNVKIITANGVVTLRGPVNSAAEKTRIGELATQNAGNAKVENQLEVTNSN